MTAKHILILGALAMGLAVILGAFGAHALKPRLPAESLSIYQTAVLYHFVHALSLLMVGLLLLHVPELVWFKWASWGLTLSIILFSGSLYLISVLGLRQLGWVTPVGGLGFITSWVLLTIGLYHLPAG